METTISKGNVPAPLKKFSFAGGYWQEAETVNRDATIPAVLKFWEETGRVEAIKLTWKEGMPNRPHIFWDSDVVKWIEAAAYSLATHPDKQLEAQVEALCASYAASQSPDGYINSYYNTIEPQNRFTNLRDNHELYCAGHLFEAAAALFQATGSRTLLDPALKFAALLSKTFGAEPGKRRGCCGHEEIELALVKLYHATGEKSLLALAKYFVEERGTKPNAIAPFDKSWSAEYYQADKPLKEQREALGHAVRAGYIYTAMADLAAETGDAELLAACDRLWDSITLHKMYVTGGVGSNPQGEAFTFDYDLPNEDGYCETCASIALMLFAQRMLQLEPDAKYADVIERALLNTVMAGVSHDGVSFFYANRLACVPEKFKKATFHHFPAERQKGFGCSCCPPNVARVFASLGNYFQSANANSVYVHLYGDWDCEFAVGGGTAALSQRGAYPYDGKIVTTVKTARTLQFDLMLRVPGWAGTWTAKLNGEEISRPEMVKGYLKLSRAWAEGDKIELDFAMDPVAIEAHPSVRQDAGRVALMRGPLVYCFEEVDNGKDLNDVVLDLAQPLTAKNDPALFGGAPVIEARGRRRDLKDWEGVLYRPAGRSEFKDIKLKAIPYNRWANRGGGEMLVWIRQG